MSLVLASRLLRHYCAWLTGIEAEFADAGI
jgi:hypothetical protein